MTIRVHLAVPLMAPLSLEPKQCELHIASLHELADMPSLISTDPELAGAELTLSVLDSPSDEPLLQGRWTDSHMLRTFSLLNVVIDGTACVERLRTSSQWSDGKFSESSKEQVCFQSVASNLEHELGLLLLAVNIARPGSISAIEGFAFVNGEQVGTTYPFYAETLFGAVQASSETGWPRLTSLSIYETWQWLRGSQSIVDGVGIGRLGRALAALSHLTTETLSSSSSIDLFWVLLGLEALFARGNVGLKEQLLGKSEVILGPRLENKKLFGAVYDFRSRLIHGDVDLPVRFSQFSGADKYEKFQDELRRSGEIALAALVGTFQWMVTNNRYELDFAYALREMERPDGDAT
ncbi:MAG TPA: hypothetical protein VE934_09625 [Polaromonas sp.]|uniref:hypothetical protein n=1 Tax=Polaromonas sp. TaxID=1869339 RepID=UPI002D5BFCE3|nr:hypothetical protein [Polaromonas sp.]HYW57210.1 hypothetical protein [Polaromonas sp.]